MSKNLRLPEFEKFWRAWREEQVKPLEMAEKFLKNFRAKLKEPLPVQVVMPTYIAGYLFQDLPNAWADVINKAEESRLAIKNEDLWAEVSFFMAYRRTKAIWNVDPDLKSSLEGLNWPAETPASALRYLPHDSAVISVGANEAVCVWYDLWYEDENKKIINTFDPKREDDDKLVPILGLRIGYCEFKNQTIRPILALNLSDNLTLDASLDYCTENFSQWSDPEVEEVVSELNTLGVAVHGGIGLTQKQKSHRSFPPRQTIVDTYRTLVNVLLYACGNEDILAHVGHIYPPVANKVRRRVQEDKMFKKDYADPREYEVGVKFGSAIRRYLEQERVEHGATNAGGTVRPHLRRAHPHLYWVGEGRTKSIVKYLPPIPVNKGKLMEESPVVSIHRVS